jgi:hypothetical protein
MLSGKPVTGIRKPSVTNKKQGSKNLRKPANVEVGNAKLQTVVVDGGCIARHEDKDY